jgi:hypothetical protein
VKEQTPCFDLLSRIRRGCKKARSTVPAARLSFPLSATLAVML